MDAENAFEEEKESRPPTTEDLKNICSSLNKANCRYMPAGGLAINFYGLPRSTTDIDFIVDDSSSENVKKICEALSFLPDKTSLAL